MAYSPVPSQTQDNTYSPGSLNMIGGVRADSDVSPVSGDNDVHPFIFNPIGRLKVSVLPAGTSATTGSITTTQPVINTPVAGGTVQCDVTRQSNVMMYCTGTFAGINCSFEVSIDGGSNWFSMQAVRTNANTIETTTGALSAAPAYAWEMSVNACTHVRVRATARTSGTQVWTIMPGAFATEPIPAAQVSASQPVTMTSTTITSLVSGVAATSLGKAEDAVHATGDTGVAMWGVRNDGAAVTYGGNGDYSPMAVDAQGRNMVVSKAPTATLTNVASSATNVTVLALNTNRLGATIFNDSAQVLSIKLGATASATSFTMKIAAQGYYEVPFGYTGIIDGIWVSADGNARVTELT